MNTDSEEEAGGGLTFAPALTQQVGYFSGNKTPLVLTGW